MCYHPTKITERHKARTRPTEKTCNRCQMKIRAVLLLSQFFIILQYFIPCIQEIQITFEMYIEMMIGNFKMQHYVVFGFLLKLMKISI